jgi:hypothetical protein
MSIRAMTWAWTAALTPTPKLVLMALADIADDQGLCWPSIKALARKCSLSERSVQRVLHSLQSKELLSVEPQFRKDGSRSSNRYRLALDALPPGQIVGGWRRACQGTVTPMSGGDDAAVTPGTTNESINDTPVPPRGSARPLEENPVGGDLTFPDDLTDHQRAALRRCVAVLTQERAQEVLDELAGRMTITSVKNPIRYCSTLTERVGRGKFQPELGLKVRERRESQLSRPKPKVSTYSVESVEASRLVHAIPREIRESLERIRRRVSAPQQAISTEREDSTPLRSGDGKPPDYAA